MLLTTGIVALSRKISDKRAQKKEARDGLLNIGNSEIAKEAFGEHVQRHVEDRHLQRAGTKLKFNGPDDVAPTELETGNIVRAELPSVASPSEASTSACSKELDDMKTEHAASFPSPGRDQTPRTSLDPPPYMSPVASSPSVYSQSINTLSRQESDSQSISSGHATSVSGSVWAHGIRVRTRGAELKSGFAYHPDLFDYKVRPDQWERFTAQVIDATKFETKDWAQMVGAATATALTGALVTSVFVGRSMGRSLQEKKVKSGLLDTSAGKLGDVLKSWNEQDWKDLGLFMHLELSESAMKRKEQKSRSFRKPSSLYSSREDRERKQEERKFCIVVTRLDEEGLPADAIHEIAENDLAAEIDSKEPIYQIPELPGDDEMPVELPAELPAENLEARRETDNLPGVAELPVPMGASEKDIEADSYSKAAVQGQLRPAPLMVNAETHAALMKDTA